MGNFDIEVSEVLVTQERLTTSRLTPSGDTSSCDGLMSTDSVDDIRRVYTEYLRTSNVVDLVEVYLRIVQSIETNEDLQKKIESQSIVVIPYQMSLTEVFIIIYFMKMLLFYCYT